MRSLKNNPVHVVVNDRQDRTNVAGIVELRAGLLLSGTCLLGSASRLRASIHVIAAMVSRYASTCATTMPIALRCAAQRHWHPGYRYPVACFAHSS